jgi:hypothetical protein
MNDERELLIGAMFMLEVYGDGKWDNDDLVYSAHSMIQRASAIMGGADELPSLYPRATEILEQSRLESAIEDALEETRQAYPLR